MKRKVATSKSQTVTKTTKNLDSVYLDPENRGSFVSSPRVFEASHDQDPTVSHRDVNEYLHHNIVHVLHRPARKHFPRNRIVVSSIGELAQADLVDLQLFSSQNDDFNYLLTFIDVFSKKAFVRPLKTKHHQTVNAAFRSIFNDFVPMALQTDRGTEFTNQSIKQLMDDYGVKLYFAYNQDIKCSVVERFNRTFKGIMFKYMTSTGTRRYIDVIDKMVDAYNKRKHLSIGMAPNSVSSLNSPAVFKNLYGHSSERAIIESTTTDNPKFKVGDWVRIKYVLRPMDKGYYANWTDQIFKITHVIKGHRRPLYRLEDELGEAVRKRFYQEEIQLTNKDVPARVEKVLQHDKRKKRKLIRWLNHPEKFDSWVKESAAFDL